MIDQIYQWVSSVIISIAQFQSQETKPWNIEHTIQLKSHKRMGLEGSEFMEKMEVIDSARWSIPQAPNPLTSLGLDSCTPGELSLNEDPNCQTQLLLQVSSLIHMSLMLVLLVLSTAFIYQW